MKYSDNELTREFYIYGIFTSANGVETLRYAGKGQRVLAAGRVVYDRISHYAHKRALICKHLREKLSEMDRDGSAYSVRVIQECSDEASAFAAEAAVVFQQTGLWNLTTGGSSGWTLRPESRLKMSQSRLGKKFVPSDPKTWKENMSKAAKRRAADPQWRAQHSARLKGRSLSAEHRTALSRALKGRGGRPKGWELNELEARYFGLSPGRVILTDGQKNELRNFRYHAAARSLNKPSPT